MPNQTRVMDLGSDTGIHWQFRPEGGDWTTIQVPHGGYRKQGFKCDAGTYRAQLVIPADAKGKSIQLFFEAINFGCQILLAREGEAEQSARCIASCVLSWAPVIVDLTSHVEAGRTCVLLVKVSGRNKYQHERIGMQYEGQTGTFVPAKAKQWMVPQAAAWLEDIGEGILRGVRIVIRPSVHLSEPYLVTSVAQGTINPYVKVSNTMAAPIQGVIRTRLSSATGRSFAYPKLPEVPFTLNPHDTRRYDLLATVWGLGRESFWWPNVPYQKGYRSVLHNLEIEVVVDGKVCHTLTQRFGFREFTSRGNRYYLNGIVCNLRGDNQQEANFGTDAYGTHPGFGKPTKKCAGWAGAVDNLLRLNFNVLRIHQVPPTQYMLDVCDELGLMVVHESPVRNSEGLEDWVGGWENMINTVRELALRDRNHPAIVIWSAANEIWSNRPLSLALQGIIWTVDWTRPIIIDGIADVGKEVINMNHYQGGLGVFPEIGGDYREDRPYGETEAIWPMDNAMQGFAWMATSTRHRRLKGNADIRNYVLNNAIPTYVPGQGRDQQLLEKKVKNINWPQVTSDMEILPDIKDLWKHPNVQLIQQCYNPCTACDIQFDQENRLSNDKGEWPVKKSKLPGHTQVRRSLAVFNDTFEGEVVELSWQAKSGGKRLAGGKLDLTIPLGGFIKVPIAFTTPAAGEVQLVLKVAKGGRTLFEEGRIVFEVG